MKKKHYLLFLLASLFLLTDVVWAQTSATVSGVVIDENGETLPGVSVVEVGTTNGVLTDLNGHYTLKTTSAKPSVSFSYIGYQTTTLPLNGRTKLDVQMKVETKVLDEVVVVGYGVQKKVNLTGSVTSINFADQTEGRPIMSVSSALSGLAAGMNVTQASGQPGSDGATIRVRGNGTFNTNSPLVLVDGIEWSMDNVNPNDIESISVLKDAASTAIYGTRAANGVILITTKSGKGKPQISYSYSGVVQMPYNNLSFVSDYARYMGLVNEACENVNTKGIFSQESIDRWRAASADPNGLNEYGVPNYVAYPNTDWFDEVFDTGYSQEHNLSVSGSSEKVKYMLSLGYLDNQGVMNRWNLDSSTQKINFRTNLEAKIVKWMTVGTRLYGQKQDYGMANISNGFKYLYQTTPGVYPGEPNYWGRPALASEESSNANNIFGQMAGATGFNTVWRLNASVYGIITPYKGLNIEGTFNYSPTFTDKSSYSRQNGYWDYVTDQRVSESALENASITNTSARTWRQSAEILVRYQTTIKKDHDLGALLGYSAQEYYSKSFAVSRKGATDWTLNELSTYETLVSSSSSAPAKWGLLSYFGRVNYGYKGRYLFEANLRAEASSRFVDDRGEVQTNLGYRVQFNNAIGPYKGGIRFHASVNLSILKFLGFEQTFKNALTTLPMGGGKGGSDFSPRGKSDAEIMRFCQAFMLELWRHLGPDMDVPAGDIGVGGREVGYMFGMYKKLTREFTGTFTGKGLEFGGSLIRPEATGFGGLYFVNQMLQAKGIDIKGKTVAISGFGNVAWGAATKATELGAKVITISGPDGYIYDPDGISGEKIDYMLELRSSGNDIVAPYAEQYPNATFVEGKRPWEVKADIALPCATQNELNGEDAQNLIKNDVLCVGEISNMGCTPEAIDLFIEHKTMYAPGKAVNAGGVATSGLEMSQNAMHLSWSAAEVDEKLHAIMHGIHAQCVKYGTEPDGYINYVKGANIAGFMKVAHAMMGQGVI